MAKTQSKSLFTADLAGPGQAVSTAQAAQAVLDRLG